MIVLATDNIELSCTAWYRVSEDDAGNIDIESLVGAFTLGRHKVMPGGMMRAIQDWLGTDAGEEWILKQAEKQGATIKGG